MYKVIYSKRFRTSLKKLNRSGKKKDIIKLKELIISLSLNETLDTKYRDHNLSGNLDIYRECHINADLLLIYYKNEGKKILFLFDIGNHNGLFE